MRLGRARRPRRHRESDLKVHPRAHHQARLGAPALGYGRGLPASARRQPIRQRKDTIITRRGKEARNIAKVAAARQLLTCVFYTMRDGQARSPAAPPGVRQQTPREQARKHGQRVIARRSDPRHRAARPRL